MTCARRSPPDDIELLGVIEHASEFTTQERSVPLTPKFMTTAQFADAIGRAPQTIRAQHCKTGEAFGIKPQKLGVRLLWPTEQVQALLHVGDPTPRS